MSKNKRQAKSLERHLAQPSKENTSLLYWMLGTLVAGMVSVVLYYLMCDQSDPALNSEKSGESFGIWGPHTFFPALPCKDGECVKFAYDESFNDKKSRSLINQYIEVGEKILASLPLTLANRATLAKTTIRFVPIDPLLPDALGFVKRPREISIVLREYIEEQQLRGILLNEIHHVTVLEINKHKLGNNWDIFGNGKVVSIPFMTKDVKVDTNLREDLKHALDQVKARVKEFDSLLKKQKLSSKEEKKLSAYLAAIDDYYPIRYDRSFDISRVRFFGKVEHNAKIEMNVDGQKAYGTFYKRANEALVFFSLNRDRSRPELAKAFIYDFNKVYERSNAIHYKPKLYEMAKKTGMLNNYFLVEFSSDMDQLLTPNMKKVFAPRFIDYFDRYAESYLESEFIPSIKPFSKI